MLDPTVGENQGTRQPQGLLRQILIVRTVGLVEMRKWRSKTTSSELTQSNSLAVVMGPCMPQIEIGLSAPARAALGPFPGAQVPLFPNVCCGSPSRDLGLVKGIGLDGRREGSSQCPGQSPPWLRPSSAFYWRWLCGSRLRSPRLSQNCIRVRGGSRCPASRPREGSPQQMGGGRLPVCSSNGHALWRRVWARWGREEQPGHTPRTAPTRLSADLRLSHRWNLESRAS